MIRKRGNMPEDIIIGRDESDKKRFGNEALIYLGKHYVKMGHVTSLSNRILMDIARSHVVLISGKRGSGKCLHEDTLITLDNGSQIPIKELEYNQEKILSLNEKLKIEKSEKSDFFSRKVNKLLRIKLRSGKEIKLTPEHPLLTIKGWQETQNLRIGSRIATPRIIPAFGNKEMPEHEIKLLAYLIAEGHTKKIVLFSNSDEKIVSDFRLSLKTFDSSLELIKEKENHYRISSPSWKGKVLEHDHSRNEKGQFLKERRNKCEKRSIRKLIERENLFGLLSIQKFL
jgi:intein/homing endonuclease